EWPLTNYLVELINGSNVKYFSGGRNEQDWNTANLKMQSVLGNYGLSITDRLILINKLRQKGAGEDGFFDSLRRFVFGVPGGHANGNQESAVGSPTSPFPLSRSAFGARYSYGDSDKDVLITNANASESQKDGAQGDDEDEGASEGYGEVADLAAPSGKATAPVSSAFLQRLVDEAEASEGNGEIGTSPHHLDAHFAMGRVAPASFAGALLAQTYFRPFLPDIVTALAENVVAVLVPAKCRGRPYSELVSRLLAQGLLPLGLFRGAARWREKQLSLRPK
ncbi:hypothetical protein HK405_003019, partial [Cladochytrium tenue]